MMMKDFFDKNFKKQKEWIDTVMRDKISQIAKRHHEEPFLYSLLLDILHAETVEEMQDAVDKLNTNGYWLRIEQSKPDIDLENMKATIKPPTVKLYELLDER